MDIGKVWVDSVIVGQRHRALDPDKVEALAESIDALGLQQPISVHLGDADDVHLIAGLHRLEAVRKLGWEQVEASFVKLSPARREMWEIAENLFRVDLTKEQRDEHIRRYAELLQEAEEADRQTAAAKVVQSEPLSKPKITTGRGNKGVAQKIADQTGLSKSTVRRALFQPDPVKVEENNARKAQDKAIKQDFSEDAAELLYDRLGVQDTPHLISLLEGASLKEIISGLRRRLHDTPVFDRGAA